MFGNSVGPRGCLVGLAFVLLSCAHNVPQDSASGDDGKQKGAKPITIDNGEGKASGVVTYPGGDRVDWKMIELPEKRLGTLDLELTWTPPRPGLQLRRDQEDELTGSALEQLGEQLGAAQLGHLDVGDHDVELAAGGALEAGARGGLAGGGVVRAELLDQELDDRRIVIDHQELRGVRHRSASLPRRTRAGAAESSR